ncbi:MAG: hypothetical protein ACJ72M_10125 [Propionibacteriaceae bacterium]
MLKVLAVDDAVRREPGGWDATGRPWYLDEQKWSALRAVRVAEAGLMRSYAHGDGCLLQFLQQALDDPDPQPCGRCSVCTGRLPAPGARAAGDVVEAARRYFRGQDVVVQPRKMWPSGLPDRKGKISFLAPGRALAFADDPAWDHELSELGQRDGPAPPSILDGLVDVLRRWSRSWERPVAVVGMPSRRYPMLVRSVAEHIAAVGRFPLVQALTISGPAPTVDAASAVRAKDLLYRTALAKGVSFTGPVLLIDDTIRTRCGQ